MPFPTFDYCIICDIIRPELGGKSILLGFYGLTPNVDITVPDINRPIVLTLLASCPPIADTTTVYEYVVVITRPDGVGIFQTPASRLAVVQDKRGNLPLWFNVAPPILSGRYSIRILVNGEVKLDTSFSIRTAALADVNRSQPVKVVPN